MNVSPWRTPTSALRRAMLGALGLGLLLCTGCIRGIAEDAVRKSLPRIIGPAERYEVHIEHTPDGQLVGGRIEDLSIIGHRVRTKDGLLIERLAVRMHKIEVDTRKKQLRRVESATFDLAVRQEDLSQLACARLHGLGKPQVLLGDSRVSVVVPARLLNGSVDTVLRGMLAVEEEQKILFIADALTVGPVAVPDLLVTAALARINPLADLRTLPVPVRVDALMMEVGVLTVRGRLFVPDAAPPPPSTSIHEASSSPTPR